MTGTTVSIAITTLNRCEDLRITLLELQKLDPRPHEILVCLDGCTDGSREMLAAFPDVTVVEHEHPQGSVSSRDKLFRMARGDLIVSLDDDSAPIQVDFVARLVEIAEEHPEAGVLCFAEVRLKGHDDRIYPSPVTDCYVASYPNCAGAIRASLYGDRACYPVFFFHAYEEPDFCLQTYAAGLTVLYTPSIEVLHRYTNVGRNMLRTHQRNARNELFSVVMRCPFPHVLWVASYRIARQFFYAATQGIDWVVREPAWWWAAVKCLAEALRQRKPVPWSVYWPWMRLARNPIPAELSELRKCFHVKNS